MYSIMKWHGQPMIDEVLLRSNLQEVQGEVTYEVELPGEKQAGHYPKEILDYKSYLTLPFFKLAKLFHDATLVDTRDEYHLVHSGAPRMPEVEADIRNIVQRSARIAKSCLALRKLLEQGKWSFKN